MCNISAAKVGCMIVDKKMAINARRAFLIAVTDRFIFYFPCHDESLIRRVSKYKQQLESIEKADRSHRDIIKVTLVIILVFNSSAYFENLHARANAIDRVAARYRCF